MVNASKAVGEMSNLVLTIVVYALVIGSILASSVFAALTIINTTALSNTYGTAVVALTAFLATGGTIIGIVWFLKYVKGLFDKKSGIGSMTA